MNLKFPLFEAWADKAVLIPTIATVIQPGITTVQCCQYIATCFRTVNFWLSAITRDHYFGLSSRSLFHCTSLYFPFILHLTPCELLHCRHHFKFLSYYPTHPLLVHTENQLKISVLTRGEKTLGVSRRDEERRRSGSFGERETRES